MSKLFKCSVNWQDNNSEPSYGTEAMILAADSYVAAAERLNMMKTVLLVILSMNLKILAQQNNYKQII